MKNLMIAILLMAGINIAQAQRTHVVKLSPQHFAVSTLKLDWEFASGAKGSWVVSPYITARDQYADSSSYSDRVLGLGIGINRKIYVAGEGRQPLTGLYAMISGTYNFYKTEYNQYTSYYTGPPNYYYYSAYTPMKQDIHSVSAAFSIGYQFTIKQLVYVDTFFGGGVRYSYTSTDDDYYNGFLDFAYRGIEPKFGVTVGLKL